MWLTALLMGLAGSLHCVGMCSPLVMAVSNISPSALTNRLLYNTGRILTYSVLGALVGFVGFLLPISRFQNLVSILLGVALLAIGIGALKVHIPLVSFWIGKFTNRLKALFAKILKKKNYGSVMFLGILNGFLPCGLVYIALTYCLTLTSPLEGSGFMILFGFGTLPVMLGLTSILQGLVKRYNINILHITRGMMILSGILLIARVFITQLHHETSLQQGVIDIVLCR